MIDLYLRSSPGSHAREALWDYFDNDDEYKAKVAAQGGDGALTRLSMLALFAIGLLGAILLLAWLAIRLFTQAAIAFVLLLAAPFALFFPLLGDGGRRAFKTWGLTLLGARARQGDLRRLPLDRPARHLDPRPRRRPGRLGHRLPALLRLHLGGLPEAHRPDRLALDRRARASPSRSRPLRLRRPRPRPPRRPTGPRRDQRHRSQDLAPRTRERLALARARPAAPPPRALRDSARALADQRLLARPGTPSRAHRGRQTGTSFRPCAQTQPLPGAPRPTPPPSSGPPLARSDPARRARLESYKEARQLLGRAERNRRRGGSRWSERDLERFAAEDRRLLERSSDPADHAHRAGYRAHRNSSSCAAPSASAPRPRSSAPANAT